MQTVVQRTLVQHCCRPVSSEDQLGHQLAPLKWAPFCACQAEQQRSRTQSCTGALSLARQSSNAASSNAPTQPCTLGINADVHVWSSSRRALLHGEMHSCTRFRDVPTTLHGKNSWPSSSCDMSGQAGLARTLTCGLGAKLCRRKKKVNVTPTHIHLKRIPEMKSCQMGR